MTGRASGTGLWLFACAKTLRENKHLLHKPALFTRRVMV